MLEDGSVPSYLSFPDFDSDGEVDLAISGDIPTQARHDYIKVTVDIHGYFSVSRVIEIIFYEFDTTIGDDNCYHVADENQPVVLSNNNPADDPDVTFTTDFDLNALKKVYQFKDESYFFSCYYATDSNNDSDLIG